MAAALGIGRETDPRSAASRRPERSPTWSNAAAPGSRSPTSPGIARSGRSTLKSASRRAHPAPRQRDADRRRGRAFCRNRRSGANPRSRHRQRNAAARRARRMADRDRVGRDASPIGLVLAQRNAERLGLPAGPRSRWRLGRWARRAASTSSCAIRLMSRRTPRPGRASPTTNPPEALFAGARRARRLPPAGPGDRTLAGEGGLAAIEIGHDQGDSAAALFGSRAHPRPARDLANRPRALLIRG